jgi:hypothetical protein
MSRGESQPAVGRTPERCLVPSPRAGSSTAEQVTLKQARGQRCTYLSGGRLSSVQLSAVTTGARGWPGGGEERVGFDSFVTALEWAEGRLFELVDGLDLPMETRPNECAQALGIARQAGLLYRGLLREVRIDDGFVTALVTLRPLVEAAILVRWIETKPGLHVEMYNAEDDRQRISSAEVWEELQARRGQRLKPTFAREQTAKLRREIRQVRARARQAGELIPERAGTLLPAIEQMAIATNDNALWEAYEGVYRIASPWTHFGGRAFVGHRVEQRADGVHTVPATLFPPLAIRSLAAPAMAVLLGSVGRICELGIERECRIIQDAVTLWPRELPAPA